MKMLERQAAQKAPKESFFPSAPRVDGCGAPLVPAGPWHRAWEPEAPLLPSEAPGLGRMAEDLVLAPCQWDLQPLGPGPVGRCRLAFHQGPFPPHSQNS